ncbi:MAG: Asp-tRNA(Asn)/Glu-tRNA(Gln) amidotransferase subunit GatC [bacterium]
MAAIKPQDVEHIAELARLRLTREEVEKFSVQLSSILEYMEKLNRVETANVEPTRQVTDLVNRSRPDTMVRQEPHVRKDILAEAPESENDGYKVPPVFSE